MQHRLSEVLQIGRALVKTAVVMCFVLLQLEVLLQHVVGEVERQEAPVGVHCFHLQTVYLLQTKSVIGVSGHHYQPDHWEDQLVVVGQHCHSPVSKRIQSGVHLRCSPWLRKTKARGMNEDKDVRDHKGQSSDCLREQARMNSSALVAPLPVWTVMKQTNSFPKAQQE